ncbi:MAG: hypothetical protein CVU84_09270 [Firmicutes bacterium HGW-Firmicutes-1]|nr:MAG: hypothetical protein CVU84_09270 [Firmicutes bacterium HGW-Firmicutes-1]
MVVSANAAPKTKATDNDRFNGYSSEQEQISRTNQDSRTNIKDLLSLKGSLNIKNSINLRESFNSRFSDRKQEKNAEYLEIVEKYSPDLVIPNKTAIENEDALRIEFLDTQSTIRTTYSDKTKVELEVLKKDLFEQVNEGKLTYREAQESIKSYIKDRRVEFKASKAAYKDAISATSYEWDAKAVEIKVVREELRTAIEANDTNDAASSIQKLYAYLLQENEFEQFKLDCMNSLF